MLEMLNSALKKMNSRALLSLGLVGAGLFIAVAVWLSNASPASAASCPVNEVAREAIDAAAGGELAALNATAAGRAYSDLAFVDEAGVAKTLEDFSGRPILVNFWATWCVPCREEMPALDALAVHYAASPFEVVAINLDLGDAGVEKAKAFLSEEGLKNLPLYADPSFSAFEKLKANGVALGLPATLLLDGDGCELGVLQGPAVWDSVDAITLVDALIAVSDKS